MSRIYSTHPPEDSKRIPNFKRYAVQPNGAIWTRTNRRFLNVRWFPIKLKKGKAGYLTAFLFKNGRYHYKLAHRLVLETFVGPCPEGKECRHLNGIGHDNRLENLCWGTKTENQQDRRRHGTDMRGERHHCNKMTYEKVREMRRLWNSGEYTKMDLARKYGLAHSTTRRILNGTGWTEA